MNKFYGTLAIVFIIACLIIYLAWHLLPIIIVASILIVAFWLLKGMFKKNKL